MLNDDILTTLSNIAIILIFGVFVRSMGQSRVSFRWIICAAAIFAGHDFFLMNGFGLLPKLFDGFERNWQGKGLAVLFSLTVASLAPFDAKKCGLTLRQCGEGRSLTYTVAILFLVGTAAWAATGERSSTTLEELAFQLTMPGLEEEIFYRGVLLFALDRAFPGKKRFAGVEFGWASGAIAILFGFGHGFYFNNNSPVMDWWLTLNTGLTGLILLWLRLRTGSVLLPIIVHNVGNLMPGLMPRMSKLTA